MNASRSKLAAVDGRGIMAVYNIGAEAVVWSAKDVTSVIWHAVLADLFAYSTTDSTLYVCLGERVVMKLKLNGYVVGFSGGCVYTLPAEGIVSTGLLLIPLVDELMQRKQFEEAVTCAKFGCGDGLWRSLSN